tara:strand:+ start:2705 stop:3256 length:552 start_codon:yes stop_codon:yes gene_type:complete
MFNDYQDEKNEYSETKYLNEELKGVRCKVLKFYDKAKNGEEILNFNKPAIQVQFRVEEGPNAGAIHYEKYNFGIDVKVVNGKEKKFHPYQLKNLILACGFESKTEKGRIEPNPFDYEYFSNIKPELYIDFEFNDKENQKYLKIKKVYSLEEFQKEKIVFNDRIEVADKIYEASKEEVKENIPF